MKSTTLEKKGRPRDEASLSGDYIYYTLVGGKGGGPPGVVPTGVNRYSYSYDHNRFATFIKELDATSHFDIYSSAYTDPLYGELIPIAEAPLLMFVSQSNDAPDEIIQAQGIPILRLCRGDPRERSRLVPSFTRHRRATGDPAWQLPDAQ